MIIDIYTNICIDIYDLYTVDPEPSCSCEAWVADRFGPVANCPSGDWTAILVEADGAFEASLGALASSFHGQAVESSIKR